MRAEGAAVPPGGETVETRVRVLEWRAETSDEEMKGLRSDLTTGLADLNSKLGKQLFATWMLVAALLSAAAAVIAAVHT